MKFYVIGLQHTQTRPEFSTCAFTMKVYHLCKMLKWLGHYVVHLGTGGSTPECDENIPLVKAEWFERLYGHPGDKYYDLDVDTPEKVAYHAAFNGACRNYLDWMRGADHSEFICCPWGTGSIKGVEKIMSKQFVVESGIGYPHTFAPYRVFESYAWMHMHLGKENHFDGKRWADVVIPNAFDTNMFTFCSRPSDTKKYFLYIGRLIPAKGIEVAIETTKCIGAKLVICGQGDWKYWCDKNPHVEYHPPVGVRERDALMGGAIACFVPTYYMEPFGGVAVESMMTGTPVISTDWGVFNETVLHGITGYRCRTLDHFRWAAMNIDKINRAAVSQWARANFSLERVANMYDEYFQQLYDLRRKGWYEIHAGRRHMTWLQNQYPQYPYDEGFQRDSVAVRQPPKRRLARETWKDAQTVESAWWGKDVDAVHWAGEQMKQDYYASKMCLSRPAMVWNMGEKSIIDIGGGPVSMLLRVNAVRKAVLEPIDIGSTARGRYYQNDIDLLQMKGEEPTLQHYDEAWMYNVLQHVDDPAKVLENLLLSGQTVRLFEWLHVDACPGHPHELSEWLFRKAFRIDEPDCEWEFEKWEVGRCPATEVLSETDYITIVAKQKVPGPQFRWKDCRYAPKDGSAQPQVAPGG